MLHLRTSSSAAVPDAVLAEELNAISDRLEQLGARLCMQPDILEEHFNDLQEIDRLAQEQRQIARLLLSQDRSPHRIDLDHLRDRLSSAIAPRRAARGQKVSVSIVNGDGGPVSQVFGQ